MPTTHTLVASQAEPGFNAQTRLRVLIPINGNEDSRWGVRYAVQQHRNGNTVEVIFLNIGEPITQWQVLRFRSQQEIAQFQAERAQAFIEDAGRPLLLEGVSFRGLFKQDDVIFSILDTAEELACDEIIVPQATSGLPGLFSKGVVNGLLRLVRDIPVISVNIEGVPVNVLPARTF